jgi:hypothetical protein
VTLVRLAISACVVSSCAAAVAGIAVAGTGKSQYLRANASLLALAKPYPDVTLTRVDHAPYRATGSDYGPVIGYTTSAYYTLKGATETQLVIAFYRRELAGWSINTTKIPCIVSAAPPGALTTGGKVSCPPSNHVDFRKGTAHIALELGGVSTTNYLVEIDYDYKT